MKGTSVAVALHDELGAGNEVSGGGRMRKARVGVCHLCIERLRHWRNV